MNIPLKHAVTCKLFPDPYDERDPVGPCTCGAAGNSGVFPMKEFNLHSPFDAPLRAQKAREEAEREKLQLYLKSPEGQKVLSDICKKAMRRIKRRGGST